jgi:hypothetical protein
MRHANKPGMDRGLFRPSSRAPLARCTTDRHLPLRFRRSWQFPRPDRLANLFDSQQIGSQRLTVSDLRRPTAAFGVEKIEQTGGSTLAGVLADVSALFRNLEMALAIAVLHAVRLGQGELALRRGHRLNSRAQIGPILFRQFLELVEPSSFPSATNASVVDSSETMLWVNALVPKQTKMFLITLVGPATASIKAIPALCNRQRQKPCVVQVVWRRDHVFGSWHGNGYAIDHLSG